MKIHAIHWRALIATILWPIYGCDAALVTPTPPDAGSKIIHEELTTILKGKPSMLAGLEAKDLSASFPHMAYVVDFNDLASGRLLAAAKPFGRRYLLLNQSKAVAEVQLTASEIGIPKFISLTEGPLASATLKAIRTAEGLPALKAQDYELRFIEAPSVHFAAVWLHSEEGDMLIPLVRVFGELSIDTPYAESEVLDALRPVVKTVLESERKNSR